MKAYTHKQAHSSIDSVRIPTLPNMLRRPLAITRGLQHATFANLESMLPLANDIEATAGPDACQCDERRGTMSSSSESISDAIDDKVIRLRE